MSDLDERKAAVLHAVVEEYIRTAQPVGSNWLAKSGGLGVSSATIRNDMAVLEREGFLRQPHTSAGRVPTDKGYRYFVDRLGRIERLRGPHRETVAQFFARAQHALEELLHDTSQLLARITDQAALVVGPQTDASSVISTQLVKLHDEVVMVVAVMSNGSVEKVVLRREGEVDDDTLTRAGAAVAGATHGNQLRDVGEPASTGDGDADAIAGDVVRELRERAKHAASEPVFVGGTSNIAAEIEEFTTATTLSRLLEMLEQQYLVVSLAHSLIDQGVTVRIGSENERVELKECSLILAPVHIEGTVAGTVGVLGPTRMDYAKAMAAVSNVSERLGRALSQ